MASIIESANTVVANDPEPAVAIPNIELLEEDGENLESAWHRLAMTLLIETIYYHFRERTDFFVGGNMFIYHSLRQARNRDFRGPDFFYVADVPRFPLRRYWVVWEEEGHYPNVIIELTSPTTVQNDRTIKRELYERTFRTPEYFLYDPDSGQLQGWRLGAAMRYEAIAPNERGWLWSEQFELWLGTWIGPFQGNEAIWLRFDDREGQVVPIGAEAQQQRAEVAEQRAVAAEQQAAAAAERAQTAETDLAELKARLAELEARK